MDWEKIKDWLGKYERDVIMYTSGIGTAYLVQWLT